ncbi:MULTISPECIES: P-II family nitrogen regulator [Aestuariimicrobium]|uniref:P-II family nitrogen regulator n=1 Tax=Aestuariimicrobium TaxID=396388 RepID=UPI0003B39E76|nr:MULTISPECIES: P-II family nitrogen regulator [Aestuariimicrobium]CAI9404882.1 Nitrogen regulatory protein P-II [Aestuariimicrobium sp. T2.26MG-19.2B]
MKLITAIVQPTILQTVQVALAQYGVTGMTVSEASGFARQRGHTEVYRGTEYTIDFISKARIEVLATDEKADRIVQVICDAARTGSVGDGKVWVSTLDQVVRIRTSETGDDAI